MAGWGLPVVASAEPSLSMPALTLVDNEDGTQSYSITIQVLVMMTLLSFLPAILIMMTSFTRIIIVFSILRQAVGLQQTPSNQILIGLALFLSAFIMTPVWTDVNARAIQPYLNEELESQQALEVAVEPFRKFMLAQTRETDLTLFLDISKSTGKYGSLDEVPMTV